MPKLEKCDEDDLKKTLIKDIILIKIQDFLQKIGFFRFFLKLQKTAKNPNSIYFLFYCFFVKIIIFCKFLLKKNMFFNKKSCFFKILYTNGPLKMVKNRSFWSKILINLVFHFHFSKSPLVYHVFLVFFIKKITKK